MYYNSIIINADVILFCINIAEKITFRGITGLVGFDQSGFRSSFALDVMTISTDGLQKVSQNNKPQVSRSVFSIRCST